MSHKFPLSQTSPQFSTPCGSRTSATKSNFPILCGLSLYRRVIAGGCFREPHWHANADELSYCLRGEALVTIFASGNVHSQLTISAGEMFFVPSGSLRAIENLEEAEKRFLIFFDTPDVQDIGLTGGIPAFADRVPGPTLGLTEKQTSRIPRLPSDLLVVDKRNPLD